MNMITTGANNKASNFSSAERKLINFTHVPIFFNTKKTKSRKRNLNSKTAYSTKRNKNLSNSDK